MSNLSVKALQFTVAPGGAGGTQDFTGFGFQPKGCIFLSNKLSADGVATDGAFLAIGVYDGTNQWCYECAIDGSGAASNTVVHGTLTDCMRTSLNGGGAADMLLTGSAFLSDGVRVTKTDAPSADTLVTVIAFGGAAISDCLAGSVQPNTDGTQLTITTGFAQKLVIMCGVTVLGGTRGEFNIGFATGTANQKGIGYRSDDAAANTTAGASIDSNDDRIVAAGSLFGDGVPEYQVTAWGGTSIGLTKAAGSTTTTRRVLYFFLGGTDLSAKVLNDAAKTSTGTQAVTGAGFQPDALLMLATSRTADGSDTLGSGGNRAASVGVLTAAEQIVYMFNEDDNNASASGRKGLDSTKGMGLLTGVTPTVDWLADHSSLDADGYTLNHTDAGGSAWKMITLALGGVTAAPPASTARMMLMGVG